MAAPDNAANLATTFVAKFNAMGDTLNGVYAPLLAEYEPNGMPPVEVLNNTLTQLPVDRIPPVFVYQDPFNMLRVVHHLHKVERELGQPDTPLTGVILGFVGEVEFNLAQVVAIPADAFFSATGDVRVPTTATIGGLVAAVEDNTLGPFEPDAADTELVNTRRAIPVPYAYLHLFTFRTMTPRQAWIQVGAQILEDNREDDCAVLLNFLRVALVVRRAAVRNHANLAPATAHTTVFAAPLDGPVNHHIHRKLNTLLPALYIPQQPQPQGLPAAQAAALIGQGLEAIRAEQREVQEATRSFSVQYPASGPPIRRLCLVGDDDNQLPEFWRFLATVKTKKIQGLPALNNLVSSRAGHLESARVHPIISASLYSTIASFELGALDLEDITQGVSPFLMCPRGYRKARTLTKNAQIYMEIHSGTAAPSLSQIEVVASNEYSIPENLHILVDFIGAYSVLWDVLVGEHHPLALLLRQHHTFWKDRGLLVQPALPTKAMQTTLIIGTLRFIQIAVLGYVQRIMQEDPDEPLPDLTPIVTAVQNRCFQALPALPLEYTHPPATNTLPPVVPRPTPPPGRPPQFSNAPTSTLQIAPVDQRHQPFIATFAQSGKAISNLRALPDQPKQVNGTDTLCLSYHLRGRCYDNCRRIDNHRKLDPKEIANMQAFLTKHL